MILLAMQDEKSNYVYAFDENKQQILNLNGTLYNYTDSTVTIERNNNYYIYNDKGSLIGSYPKDFIDMSNIAGIII